MVIMVVLYVGNLFAPNVKKYMRDIKPKQILDLYPLRYKMS